VPASQREGGATLGSVLNHTYTDGKDNDLINWLPNQLAHNLEKRATLMQLEAFVSEYISSNEWRCVVQLIYIQNLPFTQILPTTDSFFVGTDSVLASFLLNISVVVFSFIISFVFWLFMTTRIGVMSCGTAGPLGSVPGMWNHLQGDQVN